MKKMMLIVLAMLIFTLAGCIETGSSYAVLRDIKVFDEAGEEIVGAFEDSYSFYDLNQKLSTDLPVSSKLNSPAPIDLYYIVDVQANMNIIFQFKMRLNNKYDFAYFVINNEQYLLADAYDSFKEDDIFVVEFLLENITSETTTYSIYGLYLEQKTSKTIVKGSTKIEGRTYISGIYLNFLEEA